MSDEPSLPDAAPPKTCGRMVIELLDNGWDRPTPIVTFDPVGRFTPGMMMDYLPKFATEIERAQTLIRQAQAAAQRELPITLPQVQKRSAK